MGIPSSIVGAAIMNNLQEEIARAVEGSGATLAIAPADNYFQLDDAVQGMATIMGVANGGGSARRVIQGLRTTTSPLSLDVTIDPGTFVFDGRRYVITAAKLLAAGHDTFTLVATRDNYLFIAPEDPSGPASPPDRATVHIEQADVAVGAAAPATPAGTFAFARLTTDGVGVPALNSEAYPNHGTVLSQEGETALVGSGVELRRAHPGTSATTFVPTEEQIIGLGSLNTNDFGNTEDAHLWWHTATRREYLRTTYDADLPGALVFRFTRTASTAGSSGTAALSLFDDNDYDDGTSIAIHAKISALNENNDAGAYVAKLFFFAYQTAGGWVLDGSTVDDPEQEYGANAIANGVGANGQVAGDFIEILLTGHSGVSDTMEWLVQIEAIIAAPGAQALPVL